MAYSSHNSFWGAVKEAADTVAWDLIHDLDGIPSEIWEQIPAEYIETDEDDSEVISEDSLKEWFHQLFDDADDIGDWLDQISDFAIACDLAREGEKREKAKAADTAKASQE